MFWKKLFRRRTQPNRFLHLLCEQAGYTQRGLEALLAYVRAPDAERAAQMRAAEHDADEVRRILIDELNRTFVTPLDREDLYALSRAIDDVLDYANTTVEEMVTLGVQPNQYLERMVSLLRDAAEEINRGVQRLADHPTIANDHAIRAKALENRVETVYREAIAALFGAPHTLEQVVEMLKLREIYRHLSNAADRCDEAANVVCNIVVKQM